jgi:hypothetical protein
VVVVLALLAGYLMFGRSGGDDVTASSPAVHHHTPQDVVQLVGLKDTDLRGLHTQLIPGGDKVQGQVTLDACGAAFTSEGHRVARRQVRVLTAAGQGVGVSNEVVMYDSPTSAAVAVTQWQSALTHCPAGVVHSHVAGIGNVQYSHLSSTKRTVGGIDQVTSTFTVSQVGTKNVVHGGAVMVRKGAVLDIVWLFGSPTVSAADLTVADQLVAVTAARIPAA